MLKIGDRIIADDLPPYIIAELGVNHDGSLERALELTHIAHRAKADAIKLQYFQAEKLMSRACRLAEYQANAGETDPVDMLSRLELPLDAMSRVVSLAHQLHMHAIVTVFSVELVAEAGKLLWDAFKVASPDVINHPLLDALARIGKPLLVSTGAADMNEILRTESWLKGYPHTFFQCVSAYPTPIHYASIAGRIAMQRAGVPALGYSDHTTGIETGAIAVASGARILEKHLTHDRKASGPDHAASLDEGGFAHYVRLSHEAFAMLGPQEKRVLPIEQDVRSVSRQSLVTVRRLRSGEIIRNTDIAIKRPGTGIAPFELDRIINRATVREIAADTPIMESDLA
ncbi:MAG TPA: N-acetylneuraminate synthase family protein [Phycisphaerales bacterium]|nr:N-acetylneuraminate synthase family protein [Phycisphaerales bacterium]